MPHWITIVVQASFLAVILYCVWLVREIRRAPLIDETCPRCNDRGYIPFEVLSHPNPRVTVYERHERPCHCTAGIGKTRRRVA